MAQSLGAVSITLSRWIFNFKIFMAAKTQVTHWKISTVSLKNATRHSSFWRNASLVCSINRDNTHPHVNRIVAKQDSPAVFRQQKGSQIWHFGACQLANYGTSARHWRLCTRRKSTVCDHQHTRTDFFLICKSWVFNTKWSINTKRTLIHTPCHKSRILQTWFSANLCLKYTVSGYKWTLMKENSFIYF